MIKGKNLVFEYIRRDEEGNVEGINQALNIPKFHIKKGDFLAILGHNGSGKSTLARQINALLYPTEGAIWIEGDDTKEKEKLWEIRKKVGMVFQNPDNQIVGNLVEEDVAFGPENIGVPSKNIWTRVKNSLSSVEMLSYRKFSPHHLSGGQKQRVAIAGVMAMEPHCIILDEATAMLDPIGRKEVLSTIKTLNQKEKMTVILITHHMDEVINADKILVMNEGKIVMEGTPKEIFLQVDKLQKLRLDVPQVTKLAHELRKSGVAVKEPVLTMDELLEEIQCQLSLIN